jgi:hypothetical protein
LRGNVDCVYQHDAQLQVNVKCRKSRSPWNAVYSKTWNCTLRRTHLYSKPSSSTLLPSSKLPPSTAQSVALPLLFKQHWGLQTRLGNMTNTPDDVMERPYMLHDVAANAQRLSAILPPGDWGVEGPRRIVRQPSGIFDIVARASQDNTESEQLILDTSKPPAKPPKNANSATKPSCLKRVLRGICQCFSMQRRER